MITWERLTVGECGVYTDLDARYAVLHRGSVCKYTVFKNGQALRIGFETQKAAKDWVENELSRGNETRESGR